jgi:hypothetical protein
MLAGSVPVGCQECGATWQTLAEREPGADITMVLHDKDGTYQLLCRKCSDAYERKRADFFGDTPYGFRKKLKGAH